MGSTQERPPKLSLILRYPRVVKVEVVVVVVGHLSLQLLRGVAFFHPNLTFWLRGVSILFLAGPEPLGFRLNVTIAVLPMERERSTTHRTN